MEKETTWKRDDNDTKIDECKIHLNPTLAYRLKMEESKHKHYSLSLVGFPTFSSAMLPVKELKPRLRTDKYSKLNSSVGKEPIKLLFDK